MPAGRVSIRVTGTVLESLSTTMLVLENRLDGYDTFLTGQLRVDGYADIPVRILTLDDFTILRLADKVAELASGRHWSGTLRLPHGLRSRDMPTDLAAAASARRRDLTALDEAELRYALTFLQEATTKEIRRDRITAIVSALPAVYQSINRSRILISLDVGGTLGYGGGPSLAELLSEASTLPAAEARRIMRGRLHTMPEISEAVVADVCAALKVPVSTFPKKLAASHFEVMPGAIEAVRELSYHGVVITLSNVTCLEADTDSLQRLFSPWLTDSFPSCYTGYAKPDPRAFQTAANAYRVDIGNMVHIGDDWECDVLGAIRAGALAIWVSKGRPVPDERLITQGSVLIADTLESVPAQVRTFVRRCS